MVTFRIMGINFDELKWGGLQDKHEIASLILCAISISDSKQTETKKTCVHTAGSYKSRILTSNQHSSKPQMETA
jgi:hypothetical protein